MSANQKLTHVISGRSIDGVWQEGAVLRLHFTDGSSLQIKLADPASSVMLRDKDNKLEYAD